MTSPTAEAELKKLLKGIYEERLRQKNFQNEDLLEKERECEQLRSQLERVKPALQKLHDALKAAEEKNDSRILEERIRELEEENRVLKLNDSTERIRALHLENERLSEENRVLKLPKIDPAVESMREEIEEQERVRLLLEERIQSLLLEKASLEESAEETYRSLMVREEELVGCQKAHEQERVRLEGERDRLVERLAESVSSQKRYAESVKELSEENARLAQELSSRPEEKELMHELEYYRSSSELWQEEREEILAKAYEQLRLFSKRHAEEAAAVQLLEQDFQEKSELLERAQGQLASLQGVLQNLKANCEERDTEVRRAHHHLAKKIKENALLRDALERQKTQMQDLHNTQALHKREIERMQNTVHLQRLQEEKVSLLSQEREESFQQQTQEWQTKYVTLHHEWQELKKEMMQLAKYKKGYEQLSTTLSTLKSFLGKTLDLSTESPVE